MSLSPQHLDGPSTQALAFTPRFGFRFSRTRFAVAMIFASAALVILVNETAYRNTADALGVGARLTDARIAAAGVLQLLTDAETGQRGYLLTDRVEYLAALETARREAPRMHATVSAFLEASGAGGHAASLRMARHVDETLAEIERTVKLAQAGDRAAALRVIESGAGRRQREEMRAVFDTSLSEASSRQLQSRASIDGSLWVHRVAVVVLALFGAVASSLFARHRLLYDRERTHRQHDLEQQVASRTAELRQLAGYLLTAREDEKAHLARELHDEMGGLLTAARLDVARMRRLAADNPPMLERIEQISLRLGEGVALKRRIVEDLRPSCLDTLGLKTSLANLCADVAARLGTPIRTTLDDVLLVEPARLAIYRFVQEALTNASKYAEASEIDVAVKAERGGVYVRVEDNGKGFDVALPKAATHGIAGMRFRIERLDGSMTVASEPGRGARLTAWLPPACVQAGESGTAAPVPQA